MTPSRTPQDVIYDVAALPPLRLLMPEDLAWSRLDLVRRAGYESAPGPISSHRVGATLDSAVDCAWERARSRLVDLSRESVIERSLLNFVASQKEHRDWLRSTPAQFALYDRVQLQSVATERVSRRDIASLACRVIAEMALCTSPGSSQGSVRLRPVYVVDKPSIVSDLRGWITPSASGEALQAPGKVRPTLDGGIARAGQFQGAEQSARGRRSGRTSAKVEATCHGVSWFVAL